MELVTTLCHSLSIVAVHHKHKCIRVFKVMSPERTLNEREQTVKRNSAVRNVTTLLKKTVSDTCYIPSPIHSQENKGTQCVRPSVSFCRARVMRVTLLTRGTSPPPFRPFTYGFVSRSHIPRHEVYVFVLNRFNVET